VESKLEEEEMTEQKTGEARDEFMLAPTVLVRLEGDTFGVVTVGTGEDEALVVFRGPEDAWGYQRTTGKHTAEEGFMVLGLTDVALASMLDKHGLSWVAMPEPWTGEAADRVDMFTAENFMGMLAELPLVEAEGRES
jgi:hypothetical protein